MKKTIRSVGTTKTERQLASLCETTFLKLWSYPNLYTPEGRKKGKGKGKGKELCDLLVLVEKDILIFSDKDIAYKENVDPKVMWGRWFRRSVLESADQLYGAEKWVREHASEIYLDDVCEEKFPLEIGRDVNIHLIAITNNSYFPAMRYFGGESMGSLVLASHMSMKDCLDFPFFIPDLDQVKNFVHIFDEVAIEFLLSELDTAFDFLKYLNYRARILRSGRLGLVFGEEDLLALYLQNGGLVVEDPLANLFAKAKKINGVLSIGEGYWKSYFESEERKLIRAANSKSYYWDQLIETISKHILEGTVAINLDASVLSHEQSVRYMASEGRLARTILSSAFMGKISSVPIGIRSARICSSPNRPDRFFVIVVYSNDEGNYKNNYREDRQTLIYLYLLVTKLKYPNARVITVVGTDPLGTGRRSEDIISAELAELSEQEKELAETAQREHRILSEIDSDSKGNFSDHIKEVEIKRKRPKKRRGR